MIEDGGRYRDCEIYKRPPPAAGAAAADSDTVTQRYIGLQLEDLLSY